MSINNKIIEYLDYKGISQREFSRSMNFAEGILRGSDSLKAKYIKDLSELYSDLSLNWLLFDQGDMIIEGNMANETNSYYGFKKVSSSNKELALYEELRISNSKLIESQETIISLQNQIKLLENERSSKN